MRKNRLVLVAILTALVVEQVSPSRRKQVGPKQVDRASALMIFGRLRTFS
jgi:hypothetical protein